MRVSACRSCGSASGRPFYALTGIPVHSCLLVDSREEALAFPRGDLELSLCEACGFIQNDRFDGSLQRYSTDYEETQAYSQRFMDFLDALCDDQDAKYRLAGKTALDIGCGKGEFLVRLVERTGAYGVGVDPGYRPERTVSASADRLRFIQDFYGPGTGDLGADYVACRHTLEHIADVGGFMRILRANIGLRPGVAVFFEVPDTRRVLEEGAFWDVYYEHCSYFTAGSLARLFRRTGFPVHALWKAYEDQYLMVEGRPGNGCSTPILPTEDDLEETAAQVTAFETSVAEKVARLRAEVSAWHGAGRTVTLWGSGSKAVSYLTTLGLGEEIATVTDINPHKVGKFLAGTGHEITSPERLLSVLPDVVVVMNPVYVEEIRGQLDWMGLAPEIVALD